MNTPTGDAMAYDEAVAERVRQALAVHPGVVEKRMFGGIAFMLNGHMCCGVTDDQLMARVGPEAYQEVLQRPHAREMDFTGRPLKGFIYVTPEGFADQEALETWIGLCTGFVLTLPLKS